MVLAKPEWKSCTEMSATITTEATPGAVVEYKEYPEEWSAARTADARGGEITIDGLNPNSTYQFRLKAGDEVGPELCVDTQAPNCTPKPRRCTIL
mmetsp:Transcript_14064/g.41917  ORF Transcript_14064/g.41917 Transcript_14064/m.41917 type:complete len:95 (-) Transcript_14064:53-337(-)